MRRLRWPDLTAGILFFLAGSWLCSRLLPRRIVLETFLEWLTAAAIGVLAALVVAAWRDKTLAPVRNGAAVVLGSAALGLGLVCRLIAPKTYRPAFEDWSSWIGWAGLLVICAGILCERGRPRATLTWLLAGLALVSIALETSRDVDRALKGKSVRSWNVFHYYVGSKYFPELGYFGLYAATLYADDQWQERKARAGPAESRRLAQVRDFAHIDLTRDLKRNVHVRRGEATAAFDPAVLSEERLEQLGEDTRFLRPYLARKFWRNVFWDHGYNPAPTWTVVGTPLSNLIPTGHWTFRFISNSDLPLYLGIIGLIWWAFGLRYAALGALWLFAVPFNHMRIAGGFLQYDWLFASVLAVCAWKKRAFALAGLALSWATMTRVFPGFMVLPVLLAMWRQWWTGTGSWRQRLSSDHLRFMAGLAAGALLLFAASHLTGQRLDAWPDWLHKIANHTGTHPLGEQRIGIGRLAMHAPVEGDFWAAYSGGDQAPLQESLPRRYLLQLLCLPLLSLALWKRRVLDGMILMLFGVFIAITLSRYYASMWILLPLLGAGADRHRWSWPGAWSAVCLCSMLALFHLPPHDTGSYLLANYLALLLFGGLCAGLVFSDLRRRARATEP